MKNAREMNDYEFDLAFQRRAWRDTPPPATSPSPAPHTGSTAKPPPPADPVRTKPALTMSDDEFEHAYRAKAWRAGAGEGI
jgi:hypothetical protein